MQFEWKEETSQPKSLKEVNPEELVAARGAFQRALFPLWLGRLSELDDKQQEDGMEKYMDAFRVLYPGPNQPGVERTEAMMARWAAPKDENVRQGIIEEMDVEVEQYLQSQRS